MYPSGMHTCVTAIHRDYRIIRVVVGDVVGVVVGDVVPRVVVPVGVVVPGTIGVVVGIKGAVPSTSGVCADRQSA